jgi:NadR type nicotinamide-nucleotide adenylyltransferase
MPKRIVIIGPESTGKSTLTEQLAHYFKTEWVAEYAREYIDRLARDYYEEDLLKIARGQVMREDTKAEKTNKSLLFCDTDLYVIKVWSEYKYQHCALQILTEIARRRYDLYLLTYIDVPWQEDPQREHPEPEMRTYFYRTYRDIVMGSGIPWVDIRGDQKVRFQQAVKAVENMKATGS